MTSSYKYTKSDMKWFAEMEQFEAQHAELILLLKMTGWIRPDNPDDIMLFLLSVRGTVHEQLQVLRLAARSQVATALGWTSEQSFWEKNMTLLDSKTQRESFIAACMEKLVTAEFFQDSQVRWSKGDFSVVTSTHLVIGDVWVNRIGGMLPDKLEQDIHTPEAEFGRQSLTYELWNEVLTNQSIVAVRPKINGERLVAVNRAKSVFLVGFCEIELPHTCPVKLVEYYAGEMYVLHPIVSKDIKARCVINGQKQEITFKAHPFLPLDQFVRTAQSYTTHKHDGFMMWDGKREIRVKWSPTVDVELEGQVWEVSLSSAGLHKERPRQGKQPTPLQTAMARIRTQVRGQFIAPLLLEQNVRGFGAIMALEEKMDASLSIPHMMGSKVLFLLPQNRIALIREPGKGLDMIGGKRDGSEAIVDTLIREVAEEVGLKMQASDFFYLGPSTVEAENIRWTSHIYLSIAPESIKEKRYVEIYHVPELSYFSQNNVGAPYQPWLKRLFSYVSAITSHWTHWWNIAATIWNKPLVKGTVLEVPNYLLEAMQPFMKKTEHVLMDTSHETLPEVQWKIRQIVVKTVPPQTKEEVKAVLAPFRVRQQKWVSFQELVAELKMQGYILNGPQRKKFYVQLEASGNIERAVGPGAATKEGFRLLTPPPSTG